MIASVADRILSLHGFAALAIVFALPALEASAFLGFVFPGEIAVLLGGVLAFEGRIPLGAAMAAAVLGAFLGDNVGYFVGRRWGRRILGSLGRRVPIIKHRIEEHLDQAEAYLQRRGPHAVVVGRFTAALRVMVPGLAGMAEMPYSRFAFFNGLGALVWGTSFVLLGFFAGATWRRIAAGASKIGLALLVTILLGLLATRALRRVRADGQALPDRLAALAPVAWFRRRFPLRSAWLARRVETSSPRGFLLSAVALGGVVCAWVLVGLTQDVGAHEEAVRLDPGVERFVLDNRSAALTGAMRTVTWLGSTAAVVPVAVVLGAYFLLYRRDWLPAAKLAAAIVGAVGLYDVMKPAVGRPRPPVAIHLIGASGPAFPSGHATLSVAFWGAVALVLSSHSPTKTRVLIWSAAALIALLVGISRLYLGVHWFTDVLGGDALGGLWLCIVVVISLLASSRPAALAARGLEPETPTPETEMRANMRRRDTID